MWVFIIGQNYVLAHPELNRCVINLCCIPCIINKLNPDSQIYFGHFLHLSCLNSLHSPGGFNHLDLNEVDIWLDDSHAAELQGGKMVEFLHPSAHQVRVKPCPASRRTAVGGWRCGCKVGRVSGALLGSKPGTDAACHHLLDSSKG